MPVPPIDPTAEPQTLDEILDWHRGIADALISQRATLLNAIRTKAPVSARFVGMTESEIEAYFDAQRRELDRLTVLNLVASAEATIRLDYFGRLKLKDDLSQKYRAWHKSLSGKKQLRPDFDEGGILDQLKDANVMDNHIIGRFRECLHTRHWVGHGRYWAKPAGVDRLDPSEVYSRANALLTALSKAN